MYRSQINILINILMLIDGLTVIGCGYLSLSISREWELALWQLDGYNFIALIISSMFINNFVMSQMGLYGERRSTSYWQTLWYLIIVVAIDIGALSLIITVSNLRGVLHLFLVIYAFLMLVCFAIERAILELYLEKKQKNSFNSRQILLVGCDERAAIVAKYMEQQRSWGHQFVGCIVPEGEQVESLSDLPVIGTLSELPKILRKRHIDEIVFALPSDKLIDLKPYLKECKEIGISVRIVPGMFDLASERIRAESIQGIPTLSYYSGMMSASGLLYKRALDLLGGLVGLGIFLVVYPVIGIVIKRDSSGPVLFKQKRVGQNGRVFQLYKFRTMSSDAEEKKKELMGHNEMQGLMFKIENDPRITRVGHFLRKTSLDEVPQFINVIRSEMSLVGTRPPTLDEVERYETWHRCRLSMKPGLTGLWQITGRNKIKDFSQVVKLDLQYIDEWRFGNDILILLKTIWVVLQRKGAK